MVLFQNLSDRFDLMNAMAEACGHDVSEAAGSGDLSADALRRAAFRCYGCRSAETCKAMLAAAPDLEAAPDYCANKPLFDRLPLSLR